MISVFVTTTPTLPDWPVFGMVTPRSAGLLRTASGVSPCGTDQSISPLSRLMLTITPYGGLTIGTPWITVPEPKPPSWPPRPPRPPRPAVAEGGGGGGVLARCGASAVVPSPPPTIGRNVEPAVPI